LKTSGELAAFFGVKHDDISNWRRLGHLHPMPGKAHKHHENHVYSEKERIILGYALPLVREQHVAPRFAFDQARQRFEKEAEVIVAAAAEFADEHNGMGPTVAGMDRVLPATLNIRNLVESLVEERRLLNHGGRLTVLSLFQPSGLLASSSGSEPGWMILPEKKKIAIREKVLPLYLSETRDLPDEDRLPAPVEGLLRKAGITLEWRTLTPDCNGYNDPTEKIIFLSTKLRNNIPKQRFVTMHEYFHILLEHASCPWDDATHQFEAEADYAAVHYLVPLLTFDLVARNAPSGHGQWMKHIASHYGVSLDVIKHYVREQQLASQVFLA